MNREPAADSAIDLQIRQVRARGIDLTPERPTETAAGTLKLPAYPDAASPTSSTEPADPAQARGGIALRGAMRVPLWSPGV
jgi:hypothetical protein